MLAPLLHLGNNKLAQCPLDVFAKCLRQALPEDRPVAAVYVDDEPGRLLARVNISDIGRDYCWAEN